MNPRKSPIGGHQITRKEALKGLGDPKNWKKESDVVYAEFRAKPKKRKTLKWPFQTIKKKVTNFTRLVAVKPMPQALYAESSGKAAPASKKATAKQARRRQRKKSKRPNN